MQNIQNESLPLAFVKSVQYFCKVKFKYQYRYPLCPGSIFFAVTSTTTGMLDSLVPGTGTGTYPEIQDI
jgi:hypothetical protein